MLSFYRFLVIGIFPLVLLCFLNLRIFINVFISKSIFKREITNFAITLLIVLVFILCHTPRLLLNFYEAIDAENIGLCGPPMWSLIFHVFSNSFLPILNSMINFFIYFLACRAFRENLVNMFKCKKVEEGTVFSKISTLDDTKNSLGKEVNEMEELENANLL